MNKHYLNWICKLGMLGLLAGYISLGAKSATAQATDALELKPSETLATNQEAVAELGTTAYQVSKDSSLLFSVPDTAAISQQNNIQSTNLANSEASVKLEKTASIISQQNNIQSTNLANSEASAKLEKTASIISQQNNIQSTNLANSDASAKLEKTDSIAQITNVSQLSDLQPTDSMEQITNVSQLRDVQPSDWAYEALRSLVERYGCIAGYPDGTFKGNRAMTRYEFAAGLNSCLQQVERLITSSTAGFATKQDLATLQRLLDEFRPELTILGTRVNKLESRTAFLEGHQFSTTTKLTGQAIMAVMGAGGGAPDGNDANIILVDRVRLNLQTSFTGKDALIVGLQAYNFSGGVFGGNSVQNTLFPGSTLTEGMTKLSFEPQFAGFDPKDLSTVGSNSVNLYKLLYIFPVAKKVTLFAGTAAEVSDAFPAITPFADEGQEALSRFAAYNPVLRVSGGTSGTGLASAAGFIFSISDKIDLRALYASVNANIPGNGITLGSGLFSGSSVISTQLTLKPTNSIDIGLNYAHSYHQINILGIGSAQASANALGLDPVTLGVPVIMNSFGATATWRFTPKISLSGYGAYIKVDDSTSGVDASSEYTSWMVGLHFKDILKEGNTAGLIFGQPLFRVGADGAARLSATGVSRATPYHLEGYYRHQLTNNISITPGAFVLFNPEGDSKNETTVVGVLRTTFTF